MGSALLVRLSPVTPWRVGAESGSAGESDSLYHSDTLYSAVCSAFGQLGELEPWLEATVREPLVRFSSCYPYVDDRLFVAPPRTLWPPAHRGPAQTGKVRWKGARFVPLEVVKTLLAGEMPQEDGWLVDGESGCLLPVGRGGTATGPFRMIKRSTAPVDRLTGQAGPASTTVVLQFAPRAGLWFVAAFATVEAEAVWAPKLEGALRLLADSGFGGWRSRGFGRCGKPEVRRGEFPGLLVDAPGDGRAWWMLSLFEPGEGDHIDWTSGDYETVVRGGRVESAAGWGAAKKTVRMVREGSVLVGSELRGTVRDVAPPGFAHPVYRAGWALGVPIPWQGAE